MWSGGLCIDPADAGRRLRCSPAVTGASSRTLVGILGRFNDRLGRAVDPPEEVLDLKERLRVALGIPLHLDLSLVDFRDGPLDVGEEFVDVSVHRLSSGLGVLLGDDLPEVLLEGFTSVALRKILFEGCNDKMSD